MISDHRKTEGAAGGREERGAGGERGAQEGGGRPEGAAGRDGGREGRAEGELLSVSSLPFV